MAPPILHTPSSSRSTVRQRSSSSVSKQGTNSPVLNPDLLESEALLDDDESALMSFGGDGAAAYLGALSLEASPLPPTVSAVSTARQGSHKKASPSKPVKRPSWGPKSSPVKANLRLLDGLGHESSPNAGKAPARERTLGALSYGGTKGAQKARQSIFARPTQALKASAAGEEGDDSLYKGRASVSSSFVASPVKRMPVPMPEADAHLDVQLAEVRKLNKVFSAYEEMLSGSMGQMDDFTTRIKETNALLDSYIDLMRQTERTQQLLQESDWRGVTEDERTHALAMELAERERRRRMQEAEEQARLAAKRAEEEAEAARLAAEATQRRGQIGTARGGLRGGASSLRGSSIPKRGLSNTSTSAGAVRGRAVSSTSSTGGRTVSGGTATANRYGSVRSSGYGPRG